jgi:hypothetical protein
MISQQTSFDKIRLAKIQQVKKLELQKKQARESIIIENDFMEDEVIVIKMDVYNLFIAANLTKNVTPI